jgi:hypothetical protein
MQEEMTALEQVPRFRPDPSLEGTLPPEGEAHPPLMTEVPALTLGVGPSARAQEATKEAVPEGPSVQVGPRREAGPKWTIQQWVVPVPSKGRWCRYPPVSLLTCPR